MIRRVRVKGYKSLQDIGISLEPLTVVFGPNAAGKSNLFDALGLLSRLATQKTIKEAFKEHRGAAHEAFYFGSEGIEGIMAKTATQFTIEVDVELSQDVIEHTEKLIQQIREGLEAIPRRKVHERLLRYSVSIEFLPAYGHLRVLSEELGALTRDGRETLSRKKFIEKVGDKLHLRMEGQGAPFQRDIGLDHTLVSEPLYQPHYPHITAFREELSRWHFYYLDPASMRSETPVKEAGNIGRDGSDLAAFYNSLKNKNSPQFHAICSAFRTLVPAIQGLDVERTNTGYLQLKVQEDGVVFPSRVISDGTLRILGLLAITSAEPPATVIGYEEPENGVHPRRIKLIADLLKNAAETERTQVLINTHSPILIEHFDNPSFLVCQKEGQQTKFTPFSSKGPLWRPGEIALQLSRGDFGG